MVHIDIKARSDVETPKPRRGRRPSAELDQSSTREAEAKHRGDTDCSDDDEEDVALYQKSGKRPAVNSCRP